MSYQRKQEDQRRLKKLSKKFGEYFPSGTYYDEAKGRYIRFYRGRNYTVEKRIARRQNRRFVKRNGYYNKNHYDLWWIVY